MREQFARRADIHVALPVEDKVGAAEGAVGACRLIPHRNVRCDLAIHQPLQQPGRTIDGVACKPLRLKIEAAADPVHHGLGNGDLNHAIGSRALGIDDDPDFVVDEIVRIIALTPNRQPKPVMKIFRSPLPVHYQPTGMIIRRSSPAVPADILRRFQSSERRRPMLLSKLIWSARIVTVGSRIQCLLS